MTTAGGPLAGLQVLDLTRMLAGPYCTMLLADLGADVVKVESLEGDATRKQGPFLAEDRQREFGGYFQSINRNKRSIAIDLKQASGREIVLALTDASSVLVENFRVGVMERLGLGFETLSARNRQLVYAAIRGFGDERTGKSPLGDWPSYDIVAQCMGGLVGMTGFDVEHPTKVGPGVGDIFPAVLTTVGILAALRHAEQAGKGQFVDVGMYDGVLALCERLVYQHSYLGVVPEPEGNGHPLLCPFGVFQAADGWIAIAAPEEKFWLVLCEAMGLPELALDARYASNAARVEHREEVIGIVQGWTAQHRRSEIVQAIGGRVPCGPVNSAASIFSDPHVAARNMLVQVNQPGTERDVTIVGTPIKMTDTPARPFRRAPLLGEHTEEILSALGYEARKIKQLREAGVVLQADTVAQRGKDDRW